MDTDEQQLTEWAAHMAEARAAIEAMTVDDKLAWVLASFRRDFHKPTTADFIVLLEAIQDTRAQLAAWRQERG